MDTEEQLEALLQEQQQLRTTANLYGLGAMLATALNWISLYLALIEQSILAGILAGLGIILLTRFTVAEQEKFTILRTVADNIRKLSGHQGVFRQELGEANTIRRRITDAVLWGSGYVTGLIALGLVL